MNNIEGKPSKEEPKELFSVLKDIKDIKSLEKFNFEEAELFCGDTPKDIEKMCLQYCKDYLSGNWCQQTVDTITVKRIIGGMVNQMYHCAINNPDHSQDVPQEVAIRLYGSENKMITEELGKSKLRDMIIALIFSEKNLGPKVYGLFEEGQILKYYKVK